MRAGRERLELLDVGDLAALEQVAQVRAEHRRHLERLACTVRSSISSSVGPGLLVAARGFDLVGEQIGERERALDVVLGRADRHVARDAEALLAGQLVGAARRG